MKNIFSIIALIFFSNIYGQIKLSAIQGYWVKNKVEMKDGSDLFDRFVEDSAYAEYRIDQNEATHRSCFLFFLF